MNLMDQSPYDFITTHKTKELKVFEKFKHRTFNGEDCIYFITSLKNIYETHGTLENAFAKGLQKNDQTIENALIYFKALFFSIDHPIRTKKHVSDPLKNSACKRLCMYLRWMVRSDKASVDFGIWNKIKMSQLCLPLDVHTANASRKLGLLKRTQDDWKAVQEITSLLRKFDPKDPVKYDFALFNLSAEENFK